MSATIEVEQAALSRGKTLLNMFALTDAIDYVMDARSAGKVAWYVDPWTTPASRRHLRQHARSA